MGAYEWFMQTKFGGAWSVIKILLVKNGLEVDKLEPMYPINILITDIHEKWFVIFEHSINHLFFGYVHLL